MTTAYDELNRPTVIKELGTTPLATYTYDDLSRRTSVALGNTTTTAYGYDAQAMLQTLSHDLAGSAQDVAFTYARNQAQAISTRSWNNEAYAWSGVQDTRNHRQRAEPVHRSQRHAVRLRRQRQPERGWQLDLYLRRRQPAAQRECERHCRDPELGRKESAAADGDRRRHDEPAL